MKEQKGEEKTQLNRTSAPTSLGQDIIYLLIKIAVIVFIVVLLFTFMFGVHRVIDISMQPAIQDGDIVVFYRLDKTYVASDVLIVRYNGEQQVRRVIAVAGDVVDITEDGLLVNDSRVQESNIQEETLRYEEGISFPLTVKAGQVFVLGDGRERSIDSRLYGAVETKDTLGKVMMIVRRRNI